MNMKFFSVTDLTTSSIKETSSLYLHVNGMIYSTKLFVLFALFTNKREFNKKLSEVSDIIDDNEERFTLFKSVNEDTFS